MHREIVFVSLRYWRQIFLYEKERRWKKNLKIVTEEIIERKLYVESDHLDTKHKPVADPIPQITCNCPKLSGNIIGTRRVSILQESVPLYPFWKLLPRRINRSSERKPQLIHKTQQFSSFLTRNPIIYLRQMIFHLIQWRLIIEKLNLYYNFSFLKEN